jgi:glycosyltransferase involved in cell wall biosynthesis
MIDISIIIPAYNRLWSLPEAIASCRQNACASEIIVIDDGSSDGTWDWLHTQPGVIAVRQDNWGKCNAVNRGFEMARGEYVRFLDSDDLLPAGANDLQLKAARETSADIVVAGKIERDEAAKTEHACPWVRCDDFVAQQLGECDSSHYSAYLFRREFLAGIRHRQEFAYRDDRMFVIEAALAGPRVAAVDQPCLIHRHHAKGRLQFGIGQLSVVTNWQELQMFRKAAKLLEAGNAFDTRRKRAMTRPLWWLAHRTAATHMVEARQIIAWIRELDPGFVIPQTGVAGAMHRIFGFSITQALIGMARKSRNAVIGLAGERR